MMYVVELREDCDAVSEVVGIMSKSDMHRMQLGKSLSRSAFLECEESAGDKNGGNEHIQYRHTNGGDFLAPGHDDAIAFGGDQYEKYRNRNPPIGEVAPCQKDFVAHFVGNEGENKNYMHW